MTFISLTHGSHFFYSWPAAVTTTSSYNSSAVAYVATYTLCDDANELFNITSDEELTDDMLSDTEWLEEYERVCFLRLDLPLPTVGLNTSITLDTSDTVTASYTSLSAGASVVTTGAAQTSSAPTTTPTGTTKTCYSWHIASSGDYRGLIEEEFGITFVDFQDWNPSIDDNCSNIIVGDGISFDLFRVRNPSINNDCSNLVVGDAYCVDGSGKLSSLATSSAPTSTISGTVDPCYEWHIITSGDYCEILEDDYGLTFDLLRVWTQVLTMIVAIL